MFLNVEDLADQRNGRSRRHSADSVQRTRRRRIFVARDRSAEMKNDDHRHHEQVTHERAELVPVRGNKKHNAAGEEDAA